MTFFVNCFRILVDNKFYISYLFCLNLVVTIAIILLSKKIIQKYFSAGGELEYSSGCLGIFQMQ